MTVCLRKTRRRRYDPDFGGLAYAIARMRRKHRFSLTAWIFLPDNWLPDHRLPDHWHAIVYPPYPLSISTVFKAVKVSTTLAILVRLGEVGELWQERFPFASLRASSRPRPTDGEGVS